MLEANGRINLGPGHPVQGSLPALLFGIMMGFIQTGRLVFP